MLISRTLQSLRHIMLALLGTMVCALLGACGGSDSPQATAQQFADALVKEDYTAAAAYMSPQLAAGERAASLFLPAMRADMVQRYGVLRTAVAQEPTLNGSDAGAIVIIWRLERIDLATTWEVQRTDQRWTITNLQSGSIEGRLTDAGVFATPTPTARTITVQLANADKLQQSTLRQSSIALLERSETVSLGLDGTATFRAVPLGSYTLRVHVPGRADNDTRLDVRGDQAPPDPLMLTPGEVQPIDPAVTLLERTPQKYIFSTLGSAGLATTWSMDIDKVLGWDADLKTLHFANTEGVGHIDASGLVQWDWQPSASLPPHWHYRPDSGEIAYIEHQDIFTLATAPGATPTRWSKIGVFEEILGWFDNDTLFVQAGTKRYVVHRGDEPFALKAETIFADYDRIVDRTGALRFLEYDGAFYQPERAELLLRANAGHVAQPSKLHRRYGWTADNQYYLVHSTAVKPGSDSGILALSQDGRVRQIAPEFVAESQFLGPGSLDRRLGASAFAPSGSQIALVWRAEGTAGIYLADAATGTMRQVSEVTPNGLYWPHADALVYVINDGDQQGTWFQPLADGTAQRLFAYRAEQVTATPDGTLLLIANNTLWRYDGRGEPQMIGEEGGTTISGEFVWPARAPTTSKPAEAASGLVQTPVGAEAAATSPTASLTTPLSTAASTLTTPPAEQRPTRVIASDVAPPSQDTQGNTTTYDAANVADGRPETAWRVPGDGAGQAITLIFDAPIRVSEMRILPGYAKIDVAAGIDRFVQNRRVKRVRLEFTNGRHFEATLRDAPELQPIPVEPLVTTFVRVVVLETTSPGENDGRDFTPMSEVETVGQSCSVAACGSLSDDLQAILATTNGNTGSITVVEAIDGDFARLFVTASDGRGDPIWAFVKREQGGWKTISSGTFFTPEELQKLGIPRSLWLE